MMHSTLVIACCAFFLASLVLRVSVGHKSHHSLRTDNYSLDRGVDRSATSRLLGENNIFGRHDEVALLRHDIYSNRDDEQGAVYQENDVVYQQENDEDSMHNDNMFVRRGDGVLASSRRIQTANATAFLNVQPSIRACECDGSTCVTVNEVKHVGDSVTICLFSNWLSIAAVSNMTLHVDGAFSRPVVNGTSDALTEVDIHGKVAVVRTMIISAFYQQADPSDLQVDATVSFVSLDGNERRRHLEAEIADYTIRDQRLLQTTKYVGSSKVVVAWVCLFSAIIVLTAEISLLSSKRRQRTPTKSHESYTHEVTYDDRSSSVVKTWL